MTAPETLLCFSRRKKRKKNLTGATKESSRKMRKKNQTRKWKKKHSSYSSDSSDSSIPPSSSSGYSPDLGNARARIRAKENDNYKKKIKRPRCSHSPGRDRTKSKRRKLEGSVRKGGKSKLKEKRKRKKNEKLKQRVRDTSVSSDFTPRSQSCSTCRSSSSGDICKGRSSKARSLSRSKKNKKYNDRGRSRSPINSSSDDSISSHRLERIGEKSSLRMSKEAERGYNFDTKVGSMEVSTKDHGNFLSSKRNGSFDGLNGRESVDALERYAGTDYCVGEEKEASFVDYVGNEERSRPSMRIRSIVVIPATNDIEEEDLESLLRQKALENLKKFRGKSCSLFAQSSIHRNVDDLKSQLPSISDGRICIEKEFGRDGCPDSVFQMATISTQLFFIFQIIILTTSISHGLTQDFCVADTSLPETPSGFSCKNIDNVTADDFSFTFTEGNLSPVFKFGVTFGFAQQFHGVNGLGLGIARIDIAVGGTVPIHTHPRASEMVLITSGTVVMGIISSDDNRVYYKTLNAGDAMIAPQGLQHFQINTGKTPVTFFAILNNQNPGIQVTSFALFGNDLPTSMVESTTAINATEIKRLKALLGGSG